MREQTRQALTILRRFEEQVAEAIEGGMLPDSFCQGSIYLEARGKVAGLMTEGRDAEAMAYALTIIDAYRADVMPRVDDTAEAGAYGFADEAMIEEQPSVITDTLFDLERLDSMDPVARNKWYASLSPLERKQMARVCGMFVGLTIVGPFVDLSAQLERAQRETKKAHRNRSMKRRR